MFIINRSAFCSLSVVGRNAMLTPTPRAVSPKDVVRIYVPPAPPAEPQQKPFKSINSSTKDKQPDNSNGCVGNLNSISSQIRNLPTTLSGLQTQHESNKDTFFYGSSEDLTPVHYAFNRTDDESLIRSFVDASKNSNSLDYIGTGTITSSSSRRGSLSRKSPSAVFETNVCSHIINRRLSNSLNNFEVSIIRSNMTSTENLSRIERNDNLITARRRNSISNGVTESKVIMTSFEKLAAARYKGSETDLNEYSIKTLNDNYSPDDEENYSYSYYDYKLAESRQQQKSTSIEINKRFVSESNIQYESLTHSPSKEIEYQALNKRRPNSSGNETSLNNSYVVPASSKTTSIKEYKRFYGTSNEDTCDDEPRKSSDESSSSPNSKSVLNSPDTIPLLQSSPPIPPSHIPLAKIKTVKSKSRDLIKSPTSPPPPRPSRIPVMVRNFCSNFEMYELSINTFFHLFKIKSQQSGNEWSVTKSSPISTSAAHSTNSPNELSRVLPPIEVINNNIRTSQRTPTSPNGQVFSFSSNRMKKMHPQNGSTTRTQTTDMNTIRIRVNQNDD